MENNFNNINLDYYKIFYYVAKEKNLTKAAEKLFISQPAVTQTINKLEKLLGENLFFRNNKGIILTQMGEKLFHEVDNSLFFLNKIPTVIQNDKDVVCGTIKIGGGTNILKEVFPDAVSNFLLCYPNINFCLIDEHKSILLEELLNGEVDIAIVQNQGIDKEKFVVTPLIQDNFKFFCHKDYKIEKLNNIKDLEKYDFILPLKEMTTRKLIDEILETYNLKLNIKFEISGQNLASSLVLKNLGIGFAPYKNIKKDVESGLFKIIDVNIDLPVVDYCVVTLKQYSSSATRAFLPFLLEQEN